MKVKRESYFWKPWYPPELNEGEGMNQRTTTIDGVEYEVVSESEHGTVTLVRVDEIDPLAQEMVRTYNKQRAELRGEFATPKWAEMDAEMRNLWREFARKFASESDLPDIKLGWKVCRNAGNGHYLSALPNSGHSMIYRTHKWTSRKPGWGAITVFGSYEDAAAFGRGLECPPDFFIHSPLSIRSVRIVRVAYIESRDKNVWAVGQSPVTGYFPPGTVFADAVYLLDEEEEQPKEEE